MINDTSHIALAALHRQMVARVRQLDMLAARSRTKGQGQEAARYDELSDQALMAYVELKRRWTRR
jgi:hypothetical protein